MLQNWPNADVPDFQKNVTTIYQYLAEVALKVLSCMAIGLQMVSCKYFLWQI